MIRSFLMLVAATRRGRGALAVNLLAAAIISAAVAMLLAPDEPYAQRIAVVPPSR